VPLDDFKPK